LIFNTDQEALMRRLATALLLGIFLIVGSACTYHRAYLEYSEYDQKTPLKAGSWNGERLGDIRAGEGGALWVKCTDAARGSIWILMDDTKKMGGNAIGDIRWTPQNPKHSSDRPTCKKKWGWFLVWPVLVTPGFMSARVDAVAYRIPEGASQRADLYVIPDGPEDRERLVEQILADTGMVTGSRR
jgi:hypothetical protein